jgi:hypothetical protein
MLLNYPLHDKEFEVCISLLVGLMPKAVCLRIRKNHMLVMYCKNYIMILKTSTELCLCPFKVKGGQSTLFIVKNTANN